MIVNFDTVKFFSDDMDINNISLDDNDDDVDLENIIHVRLVAWCNEYKQRKALKKS